MGWGWSTRRSSLSDTSIEAKRHVDSGCPMRGTRRVCQNKNSVALWARNHTNLTKSHKSRSWYTDWKIFDRFERFLREAHFLHFWHTSFFVPVPYTLHWPPDRQYVDWVQTILWLELRQYYGWSSIDVLSKPMPPENEKQGWRRKFRRPVGKFPCTNRDSLLHGWRKVHTFAVRNQ